MAAPVTYRSTDGSAPVLDGQAGSLVALLKAVLVDGYGAKAAAGWTNPYSATNARVLRMGGGNQFYLDVNDNGASNGLTGASGKEAATRGYEVMTAVGTGTGPFPTTAQVAAATANWRKSATADATARGWFVVADDRSFLLGILDGDVSSVYKLYIFGDIFSFKAADAYRVLISVKTGVNTSDPAGTFGNVLSGNTGLLTAGMWVPRISAGTGTSNFVAMTTVGSGWETNASFTASLDGNLQMAPILVTTDFSPTILRGRLRGLYQILTPVGLAEGDTFSGSGEYAGRAFLVVKGFGATAARCLAVETTAWDTSS